MPGLVGIFMVVGGLVTVAGLVMILIRAFRHGIFWGLFVLLIPYLGALGFAAGNWREAKNGFYVLLVGTLLTVVALYGGADKELELAEKVAQVDSKVEEKTGVSIKHIPQTEKVAELLDKRPTEIEVPNQERAEALGVDTSQDVFEEEALAELEGPGIEPMSPPEELVESPQPKIKLVKKSFQPVSRQRLKDYLDTPIRLHMLGGEVEEGIVENISDAGDSVTVRQSAGTGEVSYEYPFARVEWMEVLAKTGTVPAPEEDVVNEGEVTPVFLPEDAEPGEPEPAAESGLPEQQTEVQETAPVSE